MPRKSKKVVEGFHTYTPKRYKFRNPDSPVRPYGRRKGRKVTHGYAAKRP